MNIIGIIVLFFCGVTCMTWCSKDGVLFFVNYNRLAYILWSISLGLYDLQLSALYHPSLAINVIGIIIILNFWILDIVLPNDIKELFKIYTNIESVSKIYKLGVFFVLGLGFLSFIVNLRNGALRFFLENKGARNNISLSYFLGLMVVVSQFFYIYARSHFKKINRQFIFYMGMSAISLFFIFANLSRGHLLYWGITILIFELCDYMRRKKVFSITFKQVIYIGIIIFVAIWGFGYIGDSRTKYVFTNGPAYQYQMDSNIPSGFVWTYIYISSPLENARYALEEINVEHYSFFNKMLYPVIKLVSNFVGMGNDYSMFVASFDDVKPYLWNSVGLNMGSFIMDAYQDLDIIGIIVYILCYDLIALFTHRIINSKKYLNISKALIVPLVFQTAIWSVFTSSVFNVSIIWICVVCVMMWDKFDKKLHI